MRPALQTVRSQIELSQKREREPMIQPFVNTGVSLQISMFKVNLGQNMQEDYKCQVQWDKYRKSCLRKRETSQNSEGTVSETKPLSFDQDNLIILSNKIRALRNSILVLTHCCGESLQHSLLCRGLMCCILGGHSPSLRRVRARTQGGNHGGTALANVLVIYNPGPTCLGMILPTVGWTLPGQLIIKTGPQDRPVGQSDLGNSSPEALWSDVCGLCQDND